MAAQTASSIVTGHSVTFMSAVEVMIAGSPNSTIAPGSTLLLGEGALVSTAAIGASFLAFEAGVGVGSAVEAAFATCSW
jgi:hypothetical protein